LNRQNRPYPHAGCYVGLQQRCLYGAGKGMINPAVRLGYAVVPEKFVVYGGLGGAIRRVTRCDLSQQNPWLGAGQTVLDTHAGPTVVQRLYLDAGERAGAAACLRPGAQFR
ncbi:MAG: hypothetical protein WKG07_29740, partial [Hymenobacter sp.]